MDIRNSFHIYNECQCKLFIDKINLNKFSRFFKPLYLGLPQTQTDAINRWLEINHQETNEDIKFIFNDAKDYAKSVIADRQISDYNHKRIFPINNDINPKQNHFIEETLRSIFEYHYKSSYIDDWNSIKNARSLALICALATYLKRGDIKKCGNIPLEKIPKFLDREQKRFIVKLQRTTPIKKVFEFKFISRKIFRFFRRLKIIS